MGVDNKTPEFLKMSPAGKVPVMSTPSGSITESNAILKYVARVRSDNTLLGSTTYEASLVDQWLDFVNNEIEPTRAILAFPHWGLTTFKQNVYQSAKKDLIAALKIVNQHLLFHTYLVGQSITVADIALATALVFAFTHFFDSAVQAELPNLMRWFNTLVNQPYFKQVIGEVVVITTEVLAPGQEAAAPKKDGAKKDAPKKDAPKKEAAPKKEVAPAAPVVVAPKPVKVVNPLDALPASTMKLDDVKRGFFACKPYSAEYFPAQFWEQFDAEGFSLYETKYAYPEDLEKDSYTDNLCTGFLSRCEASKKYVFACANVVKVAEPKDGEGAYQIHSAFIIRGPGINAELEDVTDFEEYVFTKLDSKNEADRAKFNTLFTSDSTIEGNDVVYKRYLK